MQSWYAHTVSESMMALILPEHDQEYQGFPDTLTGVF